VEQFQKIVSQSAGPDRRQHRAFLPGVLAFLAISAFAIVHRRNRSLAAAAIAAAIGFDRWTDQAGFSSLPSGRRRGARRYWWPGMAWGILLVGLLLARGA